MEHIEEYIVVGTQPQGETDPRIAFTLRLARALHRYGTPTHHLEQTMGMVLSRLGMKGDFFSMPTGILASFGQAEEQRTSLIRGVGSETNLEKLSQLDELADKVISGECGPEEGARDIDAIVAAPGHYNAALVVFSFSLASATAARSFRGGWREIGAAATIGLVIGLAAIMLNRTENTRRVFEIIAAVIASALSMLIAQLFPHFSIYVTTLASLIILVPGLMVTTSMTELATGNLVSGTARLTGAVMIFLELAFGVALGGEIAQLLPPVRAMRPVLPPDWTLWVSLLLSPVAFMVLLKARPRDLGWIMIASIVSFGGARFGAWLLGSELGAFIGAVALGIVANTFSRWRQRPAAVMVIPGLISLVPGSIGFGSLAKFIEQDVVSGVEAAFNVALVGVALSVGLLMANVVLPSKRGL
jgi:uncharacterized membrane protein YjjP (DUF1212 family)